MNFSVLFGCQKLIFENYLVLLKKNVQLMKPIVSVDSVFAEQRAAKCGCRSIIPGGRGKFKEQTMSYFVSNVYFIFNNCFILLSALCCI